VRWRCQRFDEKFQAALKALLWSTYALHFVEGESESDFRQNVIQHAKHILVDEYRN
jgi:hypothetical protein